MPHPGLPDIVYQFTDAKAARLIISNRTLRIGRPTEMNDPFDGYIDDLFDVELKDRYNGAVVTLVDMSTPAFFARLRDAVVLAALPDVYPRAAFQRYCAHIVRKSSTRRGSPIRRRTPIPGPPAR